MFLGKVLGLGVGYWLFNLPGAVVGLVCGYFYDKRRAENTLERVAQEQQVQLSAQQIESIRQSFFKTTFSVMGHVAKSDGKVNKSQIKFAENIMDRMGLSAQLRSSAINRFNEGKRADFNLDRSVKSFRDECANSTGMYRVFLEVQIQAALADGVMVPEEEAILRHAARVLGFSETLFRQLEVLVRVSLGLGDNHNQRYTQSRNRDNQHSGSQTNADAFDNASMSSASKDAHQMLGVKPNADAQSVKIAYRKLMNQHHPDKLASKGLPDEMLRLATDKTQDIQMAYELIKKANGW